MKQYTAKVKIGAIKFKSTSYYGNPSYWLFWCDEIESGHVHGYTASNASCGYYVCNSLIGKEIEISYHITKNNNLVIDIIKAVH